MAEESNIFSSRTMMWFTIVILPVIGIILSVYEIFLKQEPEPTKPRPPHTAAVVWDGQKRFEEIKALKDPPAFLELETFIALCKSEEMQKAATKHLEHIKDRLQANFSILLKTGLQEDLVQHRDLGTKVYTQEQIEKMNEKIQKFIRQGEQLDQEIAKLHKKVEKLWGNGKEADYEQAEKLCKEFIAKNPEAKGKVSPGLSELYYHWSDTRYKGFNLCLATQDTKIAKTWAVKAREKLNQCLEADTQGKYKAEIESRLKDVAAFLEKNP